MNNKSICGHSSETWSHYIDINIKQTRSCYDRTAQKAETMFDYNSLNTHFFEKCAKQVLDLKMCML
jgi:hypothetical protein